MSEALVRTALRGLMGATADNDRNWHYQFSRPLDFPTREQAVSGVVRADCSFGCKILCRLAGAPDPCGTGFDGWGNSVSMFKHLPHIPFSQLKVGDCAVFGRVNGEQHAVMIYQVAKTIDATLCWSHGMEAGPVIVPLAVEKAAHPGSTLTFLEAVPADPPKPQPVRVDVTRNGKRWLVGQKLSSPAWVKRAKSAVKAGAKSITIRRAK